MRILYRKSVKETHFQNIIGKKEKKKYLSLFICNNINLFDGILFGENRIILNQFIIKKSSAQQQQHKREQDAKHLFYDILKWSFSFHKEEKKKNTAIVIETTWYNHIVPPIDKCNKCCFNSLPFAVVFLLFLLMFTIYRNQFFFEANASSFGIKLSYICFNTRWAFFLAWYNT